MAKKKKDPMQEPRQLADIQVEFQKLCAQAGHLQYQLVIQTEELETLNLKLKAINNEAALRMKLDKVNGEAPKVSLPKVEVAETEKKDE